MYVNKSSIINPLKIFVFKVKLNYKYLKQLFISIDFIYVSNYRFVIVVYIQSVFFIQVLFILIILGYINKRRKSYPNSYIYKVLS